MKQSELIFIPSPGIGHLKAAVEIAKLLTDLDERLSITVLIMKLPFDSKINSDTRSMSVDATSRIGFVDLPQDQSTFDVSPNTFLNKFVDSHKAGVRDAVAEIVRSDSARLAGFVIDMFCTAMIDVANEFKVPTYVFFTSSAAFLGLMFHLQILQDNHNKDVTEFKDSDEELSVSSYANPVPAKVLPSVVFDKEGGCAMLLYHARRFRETKGILINTFVELEPHALKSLSDGKTPPVYPVGPILSLHGSGDNRNHESDAIMKWLDLQPPSSVVFLCFGSMGSFDQEQMKEIAHALERSGHRFLWSLRRPPPKGKMEFPSDYENLDEVLPEGFLKRTTGIGKVIGWAPQVAVLSHSSIGGFVSHCGWNSTLESVWCGVPMATWPLYAEQQMNAFQMVIELGMAVEIKMDYRKDFRISSAVILNAEEIERGIRRLMLDDGENEIRKKAKEMRTQAKMAMIAGGQSYTSLARFIEDAINSV